MLRCVCIRFSESDHAPTAAGDDKYFGFTTIDIRAAGRPANSSGPLAVVDLPLNPNRGPSFVARTCARIRTATTTTTSVFPAGDFPRARKTPGVSPPCRNPHVHRRAPFHSVTPRIIEADARWRESSSSTTARLLTTLTSRRRPFDRLCPFRATRLPSSVRVMCSSSTRALERRRRVFPPHEPLYGKRRHTCLFIYFYLYFFYHHFLF